MKTCYEVMKKDFSGFGRMASEIRRDRILQGFKDGNLNENEQGQLNVDQFVECLITYKKGAVEQIIECLTQRAIKTDDIKHVGANQILLCGEQSKMQYIAGALEMNVPDLITEPPNVYFTNSGNCGKVKLSPKGVTFYSILKKTADMVNEVFEDDATCKTPEDFVKVLENKQAEAASSGHFTATSSEYAIFNAIKENFYEAIEMHQEHQKLGTFMHGKENFENELKGEKKK